MKCQNVMEDCVCGVMSERVSLILTSGNCRGMDVSPPVINQFDSDKIDIDETLHIANTCSSSLW